MPRRTDGAAPADRRYDTHRWGRAGRGSGTGSGIPFTEELRKTLTKFCLEHNITSMADTPSGAMLWTDVWLKSMPSSFRYFGGDVVKSVVEANDARWARDPQKSFGVVDISKTPPPKGYDVILCRDALQHRPYRMVFDAFDLFSRSDAKYLLVGSYRSGTPNFDVKVHIRGADVPRTGRGDAAAATWIFRGGEHHAAGSRPPRVQPRLLEDAVRTRAGGDPRRRAPLQVLSAVLRRRPVA